MKVTCKRTVLKNIIESIVLHVANSNSGILSCVHIRFKTDRLQFIALDGNRLAILNLPGEVAEKPEKDFHLHIHGNELKKLLPLLKGDKDHIFIDLEITEERFTIIDDVNGIEFTLKPTMDGTYPGFDQLIPDYKNKKNYETFAFNHNYLKQIAKTLHSEYTKGLVFFKNKKAPLQGYIVKRMDCFNDVSQDDVVLLMPIQLDAQRNY